MKYVLWHLGLGDAIICAGLIAALIKQHEKLILPVKPENMVSVKAIFKNFPNVEFFELTNDEMASLFFLRATEEQSIRLGWYGDEDPREGESFDAWFYRQAGVDFNARWDLNPLRDYIGDNDTVGPKTYAFIHDSFERGFNIPRNKIYTPFEVVPKIHPSGILHYAKAIRNAAEIHVIDSAFLHLVESLPTMGKLYLHRYPRPETNTVFDLPKLRKPWIIYETAV